MARKTGVYYASTVGGEKVRAFTPNNLPPKNPALSVVGDLADAHNQALLSISRLKIASAMVPSPAISHDLLEFLARVLALRGPMWPASASFRSGDSRVVHSHFPREASRVQRWNVEGETIVMSSSIALPSGSPNLSSRSRSAGRVWISAECSRG